MIARTWFVAGFTLLCLAAALLLPPMAQPLAYHDFADRRTLLGIPNFLDVASNFAFLIGGVIGLVVTLYPGTRFEFPRERWPYAIFFVGVTLTALLVFGYIKGRFTTAKPGRSALETALVGSLAAGAAFLIARAIS